MRNSTLNNGSNEHAGEGLRGPTDRAIPFSERITCSVDEACDLSGLGRSKLYELIAEGAIATTTVGRRRLILMEALRAFLLDRR